ncbi:MAG: 50S ribosomal protein L11 [Candidatus Diapherotrites archaeon]|uniref:Large ribosomal subunit protein uL11 n=1 Tax=Candidatus Iainarchaeum sp. TaxID=3101447 RepID=A0A938YXW1_9ARCH|nr:50S ribosomal protein L11 [Candidatus Diapherotrites archaeon]
MPEVSVLVEGGKASAGAPLGPALGPLGVNIGQVVAQINEKTKAFSGMKVPVKVDVDASTKTFTISVGSPPTSALIKKEIGIDKGAANPAKDVAGNISMEQVLKVVSMKIDNLASYKVKSAAKEVIGVCDSMGITVDGKKPRAVHREIEAGAYDSVLNEESVEKAAKVPSKPAGEKPAKKPAEGQTGSGQSPAEGQDSGK